MTVAPPAPPDDRAAAARQLEAFFLRRLLAEARPASTDPLVGGGFAGETFREMLDEQLADKMADAGGVGLAKVIGEQMGADPADLVGPRTARTASIASNLHPATSVLRPPPSDLRPPTSAPGPEAPSGLIVPVLGRVSSGYGPRVHPIHGKHTLHAGLDLAAPTGTPVSAAASGTVVHAGPAGTYGNLIRLRHPDGTETRYAHLSQVLVRSGDRVEQGQAIGAVGSTGASTGPHLHFEIRKDGKPIDPKPQLPLNDSRDRPNR